MAGNAPPAGGPVVAQLPSDAVISEITTAITATLSPDARIRRQAEDALTRLSDTPSFSVALLHLVEAAGAPTHTRQAAAVYLKNYINRFYQREDWRALPSADNNAIKAAIVQVMLRVPVLVRRQLSQVLAIIAEHEYPASWPDLVPQLCEKLNQSIVPGQPPHWVSMQGVLETLDAVFQRYPWRPRSDPLYMEINYSLSHTQQPLLAAITRVHAFIRDPSNMQTMDSDAQALIVGNAELLAKIFFCLSWQELPPFFEDNIAAFMSELRGFLSYSNPGLQESDANDLSCVEKLHVAVLEILNLYESKHDEEFRPFLQPFVQDTWQLLTLQSESPKHDGVVTAGIKFLTTVTRSPDYALFGDANVLAQVCQQIVIPNISLSNDDIELFEDNPVEYIRRDMEGSDSDTRRRGAVELVKGLCVHFERPVTEVFSRHISSLIGPEATWKQKDVALFLVTALGWKTGTFAGGVTETSSLINVVDFFRAHVLPNLTAFASSPTSLSTPIYTADIIKYIISFRNQIPKDNYATVIASCINLLGAKEPVVRTYSAACIERLLTVKDELSAPEIANGNGPKVNGQVSDATRKVRVPRVRSQDISPMLGTLLPAVFSALDLTRRHDEYIMRLLLRVVTVAKSEVAPYGSQIFAVVANILGVIIENPPANPVYCHYVFEVISALISFVGKAHVTAFESGLMGHMQSILERDIAEFVPYVFQLLSQLMALHSADLPPTYRVMIPPLLVPAMWDRRSYIRGMVQYLESYIRKNANGVVSDQQMGPILGVFNKLIASKATDHLGIQLLCTILETYELSTMASYMNSIVHLLITRLHVAKTPKYVQNLLYCLSLIVLRYGVDSLVKSTDAAQPGLMAMLLSHVWIKDVLSVIRPSDRRVCAMALSDIACASDLCAGEPYLSLWPSMITATVALIEGIQTDAGEDASDGEDDGLLESGEGNLGAHNKLRWATVTANGIEGKEIAPGTDPRGYLAERVATFTSRHPGTFTNVLARQVDPGAWQALQSYLTAIGRSVV